MEKTISTYVEEVKSTGFGDYLVVGSKRDKGVKADRQAS